MEELLVPVATEPAQNVREAPKNDFVSQEGFLNIFLAQLENQDPLNPQATHELSAQLAQFSQLEQAVRSTTQLEGISARLDQLIELSGGRSPGAPLDPIALLGRNVDFASNALTFAEGEAPLTFVLNDGENMSIEFTEASGKRHALLPANPDDMPPLVPGLYTLRVENGAMELLSPSGATVPLAAWDFDPDGDGLPNPVPDPSALAANETYSVSVSAGPSGTEPQPVALTSTGTVEAVRILDTGAVLLVRGREMDPSNITRIR